MRSRSRPPFRSQSDAGQGAPDILDILYKPRLAYHLMMALTLWVERSGVALAQPRAEEAHR